MSTGKKLAILIPLSIVIFGFVGYVAYANHQCKKIRDAEGEASLNFRDQCFVEAIPRSNAARLWLH